MKCLLKVIVLVAFYINISTASNMLEHNENLFNVKNLSHFYDDNIEDIIINNLEKELRSERHLRSEISKFEIIKSYLDGKCSEFILNGISTAKGHERVLNVSLEEIAQIATMSSGKEIKKDELKNYIKKISTNFKNYLFLEQLRSFLTEAKIEISLDEFYSQETSNFFYSFVDTPTIEGKIKKGRVIYYTPHEKYNNVVKAPFISQMVALKFLSNIIGRNIEPDFIAYKNNQEKLYRQSQAYAPCEVNNYFSMFTSPENVLINVYGHNISVSTLNPKVLKKDFVKYLSLHYHLNIDEKNSLYFYNGLILAPIPNHQKLENISEILRDSQVYMINGSLKRYESTDKQFNVINQNGSYYVDFALDPKGNLYLQRFGSRQYYKIEDIFPEGYYAAKGSIIIRNGKIRDFSFDFENNGLQSAFAIKYMLDIGLIDTRTLEKSFTICSTKFKNWYKNIVEILHIFKKNIDPVFT